MRFVISEDRLVPCRDEANGDPVTPVAALSCGQKLRHAHRDTVASNAMLWRASLDHGENSETGKSRAFRGGVNNR